MTFNVEHVILPAKVGSTSLIGTGKQRPVSWGNYFWLENNGKNLEYRVVNFWAENLESAKKKWLDDGMVHCIIYKENGRSWVLINDGRIPDDWYYNRLCFTGGYRPSDDCLKHMLAARAATSEDYEYWFNRVEYYKRLGHRLVIGNDVECLSYDFYLSDEEKAEKKRKADEKWSKVSWKVEEVKNFSATYGLDVEKMLAKELHKELIKEGSGYYYAPYIPLEGNK